MSECQHCSQTPKQHEESAVNSLADYATLMLLAHKHPEVKEIISRVAEGWRNHALPECDPLALK